MPDSPPQLQERIVARAPAWSRDELILALDLYFRVGKARQNHPDVVALSQVLRSAHGGNPADRSLRSPDSVHLKLQNFLRLDPAYRGTGMTGGGKLDAEVWAEFARDRKRLSNVASSIRKIITESRGANEADEDEDDAEAPEGRLLTRYHRSRERARGLVIRKKEHAIRSGKALACEVCDFCFETMYGQRGAGFIECHHRQPLASISPGTPTRLADLALVCSNCHSMLHRGSPWPSVEELRRALGRGEVH